MTPTERVRKWRQDNPLRYKEYSKARYAQTKETNRVKCADYRAANEDTLREKRKAYYKANKQQSILKARARRRGVKNELAWWEWRDMVSACNNTCIVPGCSASPVTMDHVQSLRFGGRHHISNIQPLCAFHNDSKGTKEIDYRER